MKRKRCQCGGADDEVDAAPAINANKPTSQDIPTANDIATEAANSRKLRLPINYNIQSPLYRNSGGPAHANVKKTLIFRNRNY
jgi:hypothetical protein